MNTSDIQSVLDEYPDFFRACYSTLRKWGYSFEEAKVEGLYRLFFVMRNLKIENPVAQTIKALYNKEVDRYRWKKARADISCPMPESAEDVFTNGSLTWQTEKEFRVLLSGLPEDSKELIVDAYFYGLTEKELAKRYGVKNGTIKSRINRSINKLRMAHDVDCT